MSINWQDVIVAIGSTVGGGAVLLSVAAWLIKTALMSKLTQETEAFKARLKADADVEIERLKSSLQKIAVEHQVRFSKLHSERAEAIAELYKRLVIVFSEGHIFVLTGGFPREGQREKYNEMAHKIEDFCSYAEVHRIYLPESICALVDEFVNPLRKAIIGVGVYGGIDYPNEQTMIQRRDAMMEAFNAFEIKIPAARTALEKEFRTLLGVE
jgi:hypothetical protein